MFLEISQNSQESTCARVSFLIKLQACEISKSIFFYRTPLAAASICEKLFFCQFLSSKHLYFRSSWVTGTICALFKGKQGNEFYLLYLQNLIKRFKLLCRSLFLKNFFIQFTLGNKIKIKHFKELSKIIELRILVKLLFLLRVFYC